MGPDGPPGGSILAGIPEHLPDELVEILSRGPGARIERIVSRGHRSAPDDWYEQAEDEFVLLVAGAAALEIAGEATLHALAPGDWLMLPAGLRHRVASTAPDQDTVWLAVFTPAAQADEPVRGAHRPR